MENKLHICFACYREFSADRMKKNMIGDISDQCMVCYGIMGGKRGFGGDATQSEEEWFLGIQERKQGLIGRGLL